MKRWLVLLAACAGSPPPKAEPPPPAPSPPPDAKPIDLVPHCPPLSYNMVGWWAHEILPACQEPPLEHGFTLCAGKPCPHQPCRKISSGSGRPMEVVYERSGGRWVGSATTEGTLRTKCTDDEAGRRSTCDSLGTTWRAERDAKGRVIAVTNGTRTSQIRYDDRGRAISIDGDDLVYDAAGKLVTFGELKLTWDERRVIREEDPKRIAEFFYDDQDRVVKIDIRDDRVGSYILTYDGPRLVSWEFGRSNVRYEYCD